MHFAEIKKRFQAISFLETALPTAVNIDQVIHFSRVA
jgi:hypothetical protein